MRSVSLIAILAVLAVWAQPGRAASSAVGDSTACVRWSVLYENRIELSRLSEPFPWNDPEDGAGMHDRVAVLAEWTPAPHLRLFAKGATGLRKIEGDIYRNRFFLEQGHIQVDVGESILGARLFLRERIFRTDHKLIPVVSNDSPNIDGRGEGAYLRIGLGGHVKLVYTESLLREESRLDRYGGMPPFEGGGDVFRFLRLKLGSGPVRTGLFLSEVRSTRVDDVVLLGADIEVGYGGVTFVGELVRSQRGRWKDLEDTSLFGVDLGKWKPNRSSAALSDETIFAAEVLGLETGNASIGRFGLVPGYRYYGRLYSGHVGEITAGLVETYLTSWWRHPAYDLLCTLEGGQLYDGSAGDEYGFLHGTVRMRLKGGFDVESGLIAGEGDSPSTVLTLLDENKLTRLSTTARLDGAGEENDLSFIADGSMNLSRSITLRSTLYLCRSAESYYWIGVELRPAPRFLCALSFGSFHPYYEGIMLKRAHAPEAPPKERRISVFTRIWFGGI